MRSQIGVHEYIIETQLVNVVFHFGGRPMLPFSRETDPEPKGHSIMFS